VVQGPASRTAAAQVAAFASPAEKFCLCVCERERERETARVLALAPKCEKLINTKNRMSM